MKSIHLQVAITIDGNSASTLAEVLEKAIRQGTASLQSKIVEVTPTTSVPTPEPKRRMTPVEASQHALFDGKKPPDDMGLLVDTNQATKLLGVSPRKLWSMYNSGEMPKPIRMGRAVRWNYEELRAWVNAGCPPTRKWSFDG